MPYIKKDRRTLFDPTLTVLDATIERSNPTAGDLNYIITNILDDYVRVKGQSYSTYNELIGMLECCKSEYYRRRVAPYEDKKIVENGDV